MSGTLCKNVLSNKLSKLVYTNTSGKPASATLNVQKLSTTENACISVKVAACTTLPVTNTEVSTSVRSQEQFSSLAFCGSTGNYAGQMFRNSCSGIDAFDDTINGTVANTGLSATMTLPDGGGQCSFCSAGECYWPSSNYPIHQAAHSRCCCCNFGICATDHFDSNAATFTYHYPNYALPSVQARLKEVADKNNGFTVVPITPKSTNCFSNSTSGVQQLYAYYPFACICNATTAVLQSCMATGWDISDAGICGVTYHEGSYASSVDFYNDEIHTFTGKYEQTDSFRISHYSANCNTLCNYCWVPHVNRSATSNCHAICGWTYRYHSCICYGCGAPIIGMRFQNYVHAACQAVLIPRQGRCNVQDDSTMLITYNPSQTPYYSEDYAVDNNCRECCRQYFWECLFKDMSCSQTHCCTKPYMLCNGIVKWMVHDPYTKRNIAMVKGDADNSGIYHIQPECIQMSKYSNCNHCAKCCLNWEEAAEELGGITKLASLDNSNLYTCYQSCSSGNWYQHMSTPFQVADQCWISYVPCFSWFDERGKQFEWNGCLVKFHSPDLVTWTCGETSSTTQYSLHTTDGSINTTHVADFSDGNIIKAVDQFCNDSFLPGQSYIEYKVSGNQFERSGLVIGDGESVYVTDDSDTTSDTAVQLWGYDE